MKKTLYLLMCICLVFTALLALASCQLIAYTITYEVDGQVYHTQDVQPGDEIIIPEAPSKEGYKFDGWFTEDDVLWDGTVSTNQSFTVEAKFSIVDYTATFMAGGKVVDVVGFNKNTLAIVSPDVPTKVGYTGKWEDYELSNGDITINAVYTPIEYVATFKNGSEVLGNVKFTVETRSINAPSLPSKVGYTAKWEPYTIGAGDFTVNAIYTPVVYNVTFKSGDDLVSIVPFTVETESIELPVVPEKNGYHGAWESFTLGTENITVNAVYTLGEYVATFKDGDTVIATEKFTVNDMNINVPPVPEKPGYVSAWPNYTLGASNITINVIHTPIEYSATFMADGLVVGVVKFSLDTTVLNAPAVPEKYGYTGAWETYYIGTSDMVINAVYTPGVYTIVFVENGIEIGRDTYTVDDLSVNVPTPPAKVGYTAGWEDYELDCTNRIVYAKYTPIEYTATFMDGSTVVATVPFTVESESVVAPAVPEKTGYTCAWQSFSISAENKVVNAVYTAIEYSATFVADGNTVETKKFTVETDTITAPAVPAKTGYTGEWAEFELGTENITVNATYTVIEYSATFMNGTEVIDTVVFTVESESIEAPAIPEKIGYEGSWTAHEIVAENITVKTVYTAIQYTATLMDGTDVIGTLNFTIEDDVKVLPTDLEKGPHNTGIGNTFYAWYTGTDYAQASTVTAIPAGSVGDVTYYARFASTYNVSYKYTDTVSENTNPTLAIAGELLTLGAPTMAEGEFLGWYTDAAFTNAVTEIGADNTDDVTLYAKCRYTITYHTNGGTMPNGAPTSYIGGEKIIALTTYKPTKTGYTSGGWYRDESLSTSISRITKTTFGDLELYVKWKTESYTITFKNATVSDFNNKYTIESGEIVLPTNPTPDAAFANSGRFYGWYDNADFTGSPIKSIPAGSTGNITLYARFAESYTVTFKYAENLSENPNPTIVIKGDVVTLLTPTVIDGTFIAWCTDAKLQNEITELPATQSADITLYAKCEYPIVYHLYGGSDAGLPTTYVGGVAFAIRNYKPTRDGYTFANWCDDEDMKTQLRQISANSRGTVHAYAKWTPVNYTITYNNVIADGLTTSYNADTEVLLPENPTPDANQSSTATFAGWYDNPEFAGDPITSIPVGSFGNKVLYAKFVNPYTITYAYGNAFAENPNPTTGVAGEAITLQDPTMADGRFLGWYADKSFTTPISEISADQASNITVYAKCEYDIIYHLDGGVAPADLPLTYIGGVVVAIRNIKPTKEGASFVNWYADEAFRSTVRQISANDYGTLELYAKWN